MSKTIDLQVEKTMRLVNALKDRIEEVHDKGISLEELDAMINKIKELQDSSRKTDELCNRLSAQVKNTNSILAQCKEMYVSTKNIIRNNYPQDQWIQYGVIDKR